MPDHRIRLRGAWDQQPIGPNAGPARRVTLPTVWAPDELPRFRLVRRFGRPPIDPDSESAWLELLGVPGLVAVRINGRDLTGAVGDQLAPLDGLLVDRNELTLEVDLGPLDEAARAKPWGSIALVIGPRETPA